MAHTLARGIIHSHKQFVGKEAQSKVQSVRALIMLNPGEGAAGGGDSERSVGVSSSSAASSSSDAPAAAVPRVLMFQSNNSFFEFKRCCGEKLSVPCTRVFLAAGGEVESIAQLKSDDLLVCTPGTTYHAPRVRSLVTACKRRMNTQTQVVYDTPCGRRRTPSPLSTSTTCLSGPPSSSSVSNNSKSKSLSAFASETGHHGKKLGGGLSRFRNAVHRVQQKRQSEAREGGPASAPLVIDGSTKMGMADAVLAVAAAMKRAKAKSSTTASTESTSPESARQHVRTEGPHHIGMTTPRTLTPPYPDEDGRGMSSSSSYSNSSSFSPPSSSPSEESREVAASHDSEEISSSAAISSADNSPSSPAPSFSTSSTLERASWNGRRRSDVWDMKAINREGSKIRASRIRGDKHKNRRNFRAALAQCHRFAMLTKGSVVATQKCFKQIHRSRNTKKKMALVAGARMSSDRKQPTVETLCSVIHPPIFYPDNTYRGLWDCMLTVLVIYYSLAVPLRMAFELASPTKAENIFDIVISFLFIFDIGLNFCTAIKVRGTTVVDHRVIAQQYLRSWFLIDFVSSIPVDLIFINADTDSMQGADALDINKLFKMLRIFKLLRVLRLQVGFDICTTL